MTEEQASLRLDEKHPHAISISAKTGAGLDALKQAIIWELQKTCMLWRLPSALSSHARPAEK